MRAAGSSTAERTRSTVGVAVPRRAAGAVDGEELRTPTGVAHEVRRAAGVVQQEMLEDPYVRMHPPIVGCSIYTIQGVAGLGDAGCAVAGLDLGDRPLE